MKATMFKPNPFKERKVFFLPIGGQFNIYSFDGGVSSMNDDEDIDIIVQKYKKRFEGAWEELSKR